MLSSIQDTCTAILFVVADGAEWGLSSEDRQSTHKRATSAAELGEYYEVAMTNWRPDLILMKKAEVSVFASAGGARFQYMLL